MLKRKFLYLKLKQTITYVKKTKYLFTPRYTVTIKYTKKSAIADKRKA